MTGTSQKLEKRRKSCWVCGATEKLTKAHALPKLLKPKKNIKMVLCVKCHKLVDLRFQFQRQLRDARATLREVAAVYLQCKKGCSFCHTNTDEKLEGGGENKPLEGLVLGAA